MTPARQLQRRLSGLVLVHGRRALDRLSVGANDLTGSYREIFLAAVALAGRDEQVDVVSVHHALRTAGSAIRAVELADLVVELVEDATPLCVLSLLEGELRDARDRGLVESTAQAIRLAVLDRSPTWREAVADRARELLRLAAEDGQ